MNLYANTSYYFSVIIIIIIDYRVWHFFTGHVIEEMLTLLNPSLNLVHKLTFKYVLICSLTTKQNHFPVFRTRMDKHHYTMVSAYYQAK